MASKIVWKFSPVALCGLVAGFAGTAGAQSTAPAQALLDSPFTGSIGAFILNTKLKANVNGSTRQDPEIDFNEAFGKANEASRWRIDGLWRITPKHHLRLMYFDNANSRTKTLGHDVEFGDYTFLKDSSATFDYKQQTTALSYEYAFLREPNYEIAASIGLHYTKTQLGLSGQANLYHPDGSITSESGAVTSKSVPAPLPLIGLNGGWVVAPQWYLSAGASVFKINYDGYDGQWTDWRAAATWMYNKNFGVGAGLNGFTANLKVAKDAFDGRLKTGYVGAQLFVTGAY